MYDVRVQTTVYLRPEQQFDLTYDGKQVRAETILHHDNEDTVTALCSRQMKNGTVTRARYRVEMPLEDLPAMLALAVRAVFDSSARRKQHEAAARAVR